MTRGLWLACGALLGVFVIGLTYMLVGFVQVNPAHPPYHVRILLPHSGGLLERSNVSLRGEVVGRVSEVKLAAKGGVEVDLEIRDGVQIPVDTDVVVGALSLAGEQYVDFRPRAARGPFLQQGDQVTPHALTMPVPFSKLLADLASFADDLDPRDLRTIGRELAIAMGGSGDYLQRLVANSGAILAVLEESLPETLRLIDHADATIDVVGQAGADLETIARSSRKLAHALRGSDKDLRKVLRGGPAIEQVTETLRQIRAPVEEGLAAWQPLLAMIAPSSPALGALFPAIEYGADRASQVVESGSIVVLLDFSVNPVCNYGTPLRSPTIGGSPPVRLYRYCSEHAADLQQRGPYNAPRRAGDGTATPPPGVTGNETSKDRP